MVKVKVKSFVFIVIRPPLEECDPSYIFFCDGPEKQPNLNCAKKKKYFCELGSYREELSGDCQYTPDSFIILLKSDRIKLVKPPTLNLKSNMLTIIAPSVNRIRTEYLDPWIVTA